MASPRLPLVAGVLAMSLLAPGCGDDETGTPKPEPTGSVRIHFAHEVAGAPLTLLTGRYTNAAGNEYVVQTLRYIVSDFALVRGSTRFETNLAQFVAANLTDTQSILIENVPAGDYTTLAFTFGLDEEDNVDPDHGGSLPRTPEWESMRWPPLNPVDPSKWGGGYHYMQIEGNFVATSGDTLNFLTHTGRRHAENDPVLGTDPVPIPHFIDYALDGVTMTVPDGGTLDVTLTMDVNQWYGAPEIFDLNAYPISIMMDTAAQDILEGNGADAFTLTLGVPTATP